MQNPDGSPIWFELNTPDQAKAASFYADAIGWAVASSGMAEHDDYLIATAPDGQGVAGIMTPPPGAPAFPGWAIYFSVADVDAIAVQTIALGGAIMVGPMDIPAVGRFAIATDPQGVTFVVMHGDSPEPSTAFKPGPGTFGHGVWIELATPDPDGAFAFYGGLFGWTKAGAMPMGPMGDYAFIGAGEGRPGAIMSSTTTGAPARWGSYFHVRDIDAAIAAATAAGATLEQGPDPIPGGDYSAKLIDADGAAFGVVGSRREGE